MKTLGEELREIHREEVIKALDCCMPGNGCVECPYKERANCIDDVKSDALKLLEQDRERAGNHLLERRKPMPETEFTTTTDLMLITEEIHEKFFEFASGKSIWVNGLYDMKDADKNEAVICLAMIAGAAEFTSLLLSEGTDD